MDDIRKIRESKWRLERANILRAENGLEPLKKVQDPYTGLWDFERNTKNILKRASDFVSASSKKAKNIIQTIRKRPRGDDDHTDKRSRSSQKRIRRKKRKTIKKNISGGCSTRRSRKKSLTM